ncbi:MAG: HK97 family phage prohead protease [Pseudomonadota bacterium]
MKIERLRVAFNEIKANDANGSMKFTGYGAVFGNRDAYDDLIESGAFKDFISEAESDKKEWPAMLLQHGAWGVTADDLTPIGAWLSFSEDEKGLLVEGEIADTTRGLDTYKLMKMKPRPAIRGLSIGYVAREYKNGNGKEEPRRTLLKIDIIEISIVTRPANTLANVTGIKGIETIESFKDAEEMLMDSGFSRTQAVGFISRVKSLSQSDSDNGMNDIISALKKRNNIFKNN